MHNHAGCGGFAMATTYNYPLFLLAFVENILRERING